jgi:hypothetical protein
VRALLWCAAILLLLLMLVSGAAFVRGSLELFPTEEQESKVRLVYGSAFVVFGLLELAVAIWLRRVSRPSPSPARS